MEAVYIILTEFMCIIGRGHAFELVYLVPEFFFGVLNGQFDYLSCLDRSVDVVEIRGTSGIRNRVREMRKGGFAPAFSGQ